MSVLSSLLISFSSKKWTFFLSSHFFLLNLILSFHLPLQPSFSLISSQTCLSQTASLSIFPTKNKKNTKTLSRKAEKDREVLCPGRKGLGHVSGVGERCLELRSVRKQEAVFILPSLAGWLSIPLGSLAFCLKYRPQGELSLVVQLNG